MKYTVASLFSGIGGIDRAFVDAGFEITVQVEIDPFCQQVLRKHAPAYWPNARILNDVTKITGEQLGAVDVMVGGFPCQPVSVAGSRKAQADERWLWPHFERLIGEVRPRFVLLENVPGILHPVKHTRTTYAFEGKARLYQRQHTYYTQAPVYEVLAGLAALGYNAEWGIVSAANVGAPHRRDRWFCVAYARSASARMEESGTRRQGREYTNSQQSAILRQIDGTIAPKGTCASSQDVGDSAGGTGSMATGSEWQHLSDAERASETVGNAERERLQGSAGEKLRQTEVTAERSGWDTQSPFRCAVDGIRSGLGRHRWPSRPNEPQQEWEAPRTTTEKYKYRRAAIKALGNAVVHQVVYPFAVAIREALEAQDA